MFRFAYPGLLALLALQSIWFFLAWKKKPATISYSMTSGLAALVGSGKELSYRLPLFLRFGCLLFLVLASARPQLYKASRDIVLPGVDIILCLDTSASMGAMDFNQEGKPASRLEGVRKVVREFIRKREMDRIGIVVFGENAFTQCPVTFDKKLLLSLVEMLEISMAGDRTAIGEAIALGGKRLRDLQAKSKLLVLLTDGRQNEGQIRPEEAAEAVRAVGVKIYTVGVGREGPAPFKVNTAFGPRTVYQQVDLDEETLKTIASIGHGKYFRAGDSEELSEVYKVIDQEEKTEAKVRKFFQAQELYPWFLGTAVLMLIAELALKWSILRIIP